MEVIGGTASVFALYQLCTTIKDLLDFGKSVLDAPTTVKALFQDLELLELVVAQARGVAHLLTFDDTTERVLRCCESKISILHHKLAKPISRFQTGNFIQQKWSALKITLRVEDIKDLQRSIQDAKSTLQISQTNTLLTCFASVDSKQEQTLVEISSINHLIRSASKQDIFSIEENMRIRTLQYHEQKSAGDRLLNPPLDGLVPEVVEVLPVIQRQSSHVILDDTPSSRIAIRPVLQKRNLHSSRKLVLQMPLYWINIQTQTYSVTKETETSEPHTIEDTQFRCIAIPNAAGRYLGISLGTVLSARSITGWKYSFQSFRTVPDDSLIFEYCAEGNIGAIQSLFKRGLASPWDRDAKGRTPLWIAAESLQLEVAKLLLQEGADPAERDWRYDMETIYAVVDSKNSALEPRLNMIRLLQSHHSDYDDFNLLFMIGRFILKYRPNSNLPISWAARREGVVQLLNLLLGGMHLQHHPVSGLLYFAVTLLYEKEVLRWILQNFKGSIDGSGEGESRYDTLYGGICARLLERDFESMRCIVQRRGDLHCLSRVGPIRTREMETPTSQAMNDMESFLLWRKLLGEVGVDIKEFVRRELEVTEWGLRGKGWDEGSLEYLFTSPDIASGVDKYKGKRIWRGTFPPCERCGNHGTSCGEKLMVDLAWRRRLRDIRRRFSAARPAMITEKKDNNVVMVGEVIGIEIELDRKGGYGNFMSVEVDTGLGVGVGEEDVALPYRIVCPRACEDGVCVAWVFEDSAANAGASIKFPAYPQEMREEEGHKMDVVRIEEVEDLPTKSMPGAFVE